METQPHNRVSTKNVWVASGMVILLTICTYQLFVIQQYKNDKTDEIDMVTSVPKTSADTSLNLGNLGVTGLTGANNNLFNSLSDSNKEKLRDIKEKLPNKVNQLDTAKSSTEKRKILNTVKPAGYIDSTNRFILASAALIRENAYKGTIDSLKKKLNISEQENKRRTTAPVLQVVGSRQELQNNLINPVFKIDSQRPDYYIVQEKKREFEGKRMINPYRNFSNIYTNSTPPQLIFSYPEIDDEVYLLMLQFRQSYNFGTHAANIGLGAEVKLSRFSGNVVYNVNPFKSLKGSFVIGTRQDIFKRNLLKKKKK